jgi:FkbM family methyltransferase
MNWLIIRKLFFSLSSPLAMRALRKGVGASLEHTESFSSYEFTTVVDVGANKGQFSLFMRSFFPKAAIIAFEPLPGPAEKFHWIFSGEADVVLHRCALGAANERAQIHVTEHDDSSSLLAVTSQQLDAYGTREVGTVDIEVRRLDSVLARDNIIRPALLKIDVQGFEDQVLYGCGSLLECFDLIYVEASYVELYANQVMINEVAEILWKAGYRLRGIFNQSVNSANQPLQADFLFGRIGAP